MPISVWMAQAPRRRRIRILPLVLLALLIFFGVRHYEQIPRAFDALGRVELEWLALAILFQILTYVSVGVTYRLLSGALGSPVPLGAGVRMAVVNLFVNSAFPSAGLSGNLFLVRMLASRGVAAGTATVVVVLERVFYLAALVVFASFVIARILFRSGLAGIEGLTKELVALAVVAAAGVALAYAVRRGLRNPVGAAERFSRLIRRGPRWLRRRIDLRALADDARRVEESGGASALRPPRLLAVFAAETGIFLFDALTLWALFNGIGVPVTFSLAAMAYAVATLLAQIVVIPGTLEVGLAAVLASLGIRAGTALLATLLFHFLSLWAVMPFGWWFFRSSEKKLHAQKVKGRPLRPSDSRAS